MALTREATVDDQITLTAYADQAREFIRHERHDEAIGVCQHILHYYPQYVDAYCQMGNAYLEKGDHAAAKDLFRRVLSADPENLMAHVGLAVVFEQEHLLHEAVWHMERAHELAPGNPELQTELLRLYHARDDKPHARLALTPAALARTYMREGLFSQAIQELRAIVAGAPSRFDAHVALAETLWRTGRIREAVAAAQSLLERLPYCLKANLILGTAWKESGIPASAAHLQRAQALDPTNQVAFAVLGARSPLEPAKPGVPRYVPGAPPPTPPLQVTSAALAPDVEELAAKVQAPALESAVAETAPPSSFAQTLAPVQEQAAPAEPAQPVETGAELPPWLVSPQAEIVAPSAEPAPTEPVQAAELLAGLPEMAAESAPEESPAEAALPSWLVESPQAAPTALPIEQAAEGAAPEQPASVAEEMPAWLAEAPRAESKALAPPPAEAKPEVPLQSEELPAWLQVAAESAKPAEAISEPSAAAEQPQITEIPAEPVSTPIIPAPAPIERALPPAELPPSLPAPAEITQALAEYPVADIRETAPTPIAPAPPPAESAPPIVVEMPSVAAAPPERKRQPKGATHLAQARTHRDANRLNDALAEYDYVVQHAPRLIHDVIDDLEALIQQIDTPLEAHRILGDAYTRADRLAEALERYRFVLEHVK